MADLGCAENGCLTRRRMVQGGAASLALWGLLPRPVMAAGRGDPRLLVMVLRGGVDGLAMVAPVGDPMYAALRGAIAVPASGDHAGLPLDGFFSLNRNMPTLAEMYSKREALIVHAVHTPYRARSHFDGQDVLESGLAAPAPSDDGWLNRALMGFAVGGKVAPAQGLAMGAMVPLVMRGRAPVLSWIPKTYGRPIADDTAMRLLDLYNHSDPVLAKALMDGLAIDKVGEMGAATMAKTAAATQPAPKAGEAMMMTGQPAAPGVSPGNPNQFREFTEAAAAAAGFLTSAGGPRIGALSYNGWDTHANEGVIIGPLGNRLTGLDLALKTLRQGLGAAWAETVVVVVSEFGRTARVNGTAGTDHGMATVALLVGGAVKGGRVLADWPGLSDAALYEGRDLKPTRDLRAVLKGVLRDHLGIPAGSLAEKIFPGSGGTAPLDGLVA